MSRILGVVADVLPAIAAVTGVSALSFYKIYQHTVNMENECINMSYYGDLKKPLDNCTQEAIEKVIDKLLFTASPKQVAMTQFYWSNKPTIQYMGSTQSRFGTYIGIPIHYKYQSTSEVDLSELHSSSALEKSTLLETLRESLVLSENAKKFAIASAFFSANSFHLMMKFNNIAMLVGFCLTLRYVLLPFLLKMSLPLVYVTCVGVAFVWTVIYYWLCGLYYTRLTAKSDRKAGKLGDDFLDGGIEYLTKMAEKNKALRELNPETAALFQPNGDSVQNTFDIHDLPTSRRLQRLQKLKEQLQPKDPVETSNS